MAAVGRATVKIAAAPAGRIPLQALVPCDKIAQFRIDFVKARVLTDLTTTGAGLQPASDGVWKGKKRWIPDAKNEKIKPSNTFPLDGTRG
jgi:hypothetical protein